MVARLNLQERNRDMKLVFSMVALMILLVPSTRIDAITTNVAGDDCEKKREACMNSCIKQHEDCDSRGNDSSYCVKQDKQCSKGCEDAWRKCSEKSFSSLFSFDSTAGIRLIY